jgi:hypothetical protein
MTLPRLAAPVITHAMIVLGAAPAEATWIEVLVKHDNYCTIGAIRACASVHVSSLTTDKGTSVTFRMRNLQGSHSADNTGGSAIRAFAAEGWGIYGDSGGMSGVNSDGSVDIVGGMLGGIQDNLHDPDGWSWYQWFEWWDKTGVFGCDVPWVLSSGPGDPQDFNYYGGWRTCLNEGVDGWVTMGFSAPGHFTALDLSYGWFFQAYNEGEVVNWLYCGPGRPDLCAASVPEPSSFLLVGIGLLFLGGVARRRTTIGAP